MTSNEPVAWAGALVGAITAVIGVLVGFGIVDWTQEQIGLILAAVTAVIALATTVVRAKVTPVAGAQNDATKV